MSRTATYHTTVSWKGNTGGIVMGNGLELDFSAPPGSRPFLMCSPRKMPSSLPPTPAS
jgi:hypothetical protein